MSKSITIINQDSGYLMIDTANALSEAGFNVSLITGRLVQRDIPLKPDIKVYNVCKYSKKTIFHRLVTWTCAFIQMIYLIWFKSGNSHLLIVSNPPIAPLLPLFCSNVFSLLIYDVYIEKPAEYLPFKKKSPISLIWIALHKKVFERAFRIFTLTGGMKNTLGNYCQEDKIVIVPVWTDSNFIKPIKPDVNPFLNTFGLNGKFIVLYSGNISLNNGLSDIIKVARLIKDPDIQFIIIGEGTGKSFLQKNVVKHQLGNVMFLPWQPTEVLPYSLASANVAIVALADSASKEAIPSKLFNYMSSGSPILSIASQEADIAELIKFHDVGRNFQSGDVEKMSEFIMDLASDNELSKKFTNNSLYTASKYTRENANIIINTVSSSF